MSTEHTNLYIGAGVMLFALFLLFGLIPMHVSVPSSVTIATTAPDFWPRCIAWILLFLGAAQTALALLHRAVPFAARREARQADGQADGQTNSQTNRQTARRTALMRFALLVLLFAYYLLIKPLGLLAASALCIPVASWLYGERRMLVLAACAVICPAVLHWFFVTVAQSSIDPGILNFM